MPNPQPTQMEQRMVTDAMIEAGLLAAENMGWEPLPEETDVIAIYTAMHAARPTADLGDDGELIDWLGDVADQRCEHTLSREALTKVRDRLILYREAREQLSNALLSGTLSMTEHVVCVHFESRADAEAMFVTLEGAALTHVENEGK